jgi:surface protein
MSALFYNLKNFNADISSWDTTGVTTINQMFQYASAFNQPLSWDTSRVTTMFGMFWVRKSRAHCGPAAVRLLLLALPPPKLLLTSPDPQLSPRTVYIPLSTLGRERRRLTSR